MATLEQILVLSLLVMCQWKLDDVVDYYLNGCVDFEQLPNKWGPDD